MSWALITHPDQVIKNRLTQAPMLVLESCLSTALEQGWKVVASDTDILSEALPPPAMDMSKLKNVQSNPHRDHGYGVIRDQDPGDER